MTRMIHLHEWATPPGGFFSGPTTERPDTMKPQRKIQAATLGGALGIVLSWILTNQGVDVTAEVGAAFSTIFASVLGYLVPNKVSD